VVKQGALPALEKSLQRKFGYNIRAVSCKDLSWKKKISFHSIDIDIDIVIDIVLLLILYCHCFVIDTVIGIIISIIDIVGRFARRPCMHCAG
jgi:hypothetical protein